MREEHKLIDVELPSGKEFQLVGQFTIVIEEETGLMMPTVFDTINRAVILDQRAIIRVDGTVVYSPRLHMDRLTKEIMEWMICNQEWAKE